ncbi:hypothetical protein SM007_35080 [Streptomyces avermitilis]|nr:hypothetical protein SM007_35080 [Streptomyces avermitilis]
MAYPREWRLALATDLPREPGASTGHAGQERRADGFPHMSVFLITGPRLTGHPADFRTHP